MPDLPQTSSSDAFHIPQVLPIFPLPNVVFFPDTYLPLHIFEPRYRDMVADASRKGLCIGMVLFKDGWEDHYYENPPVHPLGCVGRIKNMQSLDDGRSNIVLHGLQRFDITEETGDGPYRKAKITLRPGTPFKMLPNPSIRLSLRKVALQYLRSKNAQDLCKLITGPSLNDAILVNSLSSCLDLTPVEKHFLLESESLHQQSRRLIDLLKFKLQSTTNEFPGCNNS